MPTTLTAPLGPDYQYPGPMEWAPEAASQTFKAGDWVILSSGKVTLAVAAGNDVGSGKVSKVGADATGVTDTLLPVMRITDASLFLFPIYHGTPASAVTAITQVGNSLPLRNQGGVWCLNLQTDGTNDKFTVVSIDSRYPTGEQYGLLWASLDPSVRLFAN